MAKRFLSDLLEESKRIKEEPELAKIITKKGKEGVKSIMDNPKMALKEVFAIAKMETVDLLKVLKEKGIGVSIIHAANDKAFPMDKVQENIKEEQVDGFYSVKGTHNELILHPENYTALIDLALSKMGDRNNK
ncbi:MAG: hypothetical protein V1860_00185 [bacterium]